MYVYEDFFAYKSGVYYHQTGGMVGGHAIKVIGWGTDDASKLDYWLWQNSWGTSWGMQGYFMLKQGDWGCERYDIYCDPDV